MRTDSQSPTRPAPYLLTQPQHVINLGHWHCNWTLLQVATLPPPYKVPRPEGSHKNSLRWAGGLLRLRGRLGVNTGGCACSLGTTCWCAGVEFRGGGGYGESVGETVSESGVLVVCWRGLFLWECAEGPGRCCGRASPLYGASLSLWRATRLPLG